MKFVWQISYPPVNASFSYTTNTYKVGLNVLANRLTSLNGKIPLEWLNLSHQSYKIKCKNLLLKGWGKWQSDKHQYSAHSGLVWLMVTIGSTCWLGSEYVTLSVVQTQFDTMPVGYNIVSGAYWNCTQSLWYRPTLIPLFHVHLSSKISFLKKYYVFVELRINFY